MPRPRTPKAKAKATGRMMRDPARFEGRNEPIVLHGLGDPPAWVVDTERCKAATAWATISTEIPWLNSSHRVLVTVAAGILGRVIAGQEIGVQAANLLRITLGSMGATPADASKAGAMPGGDKVQDPAENYF